MQFSDILIIVLFLAGTFYAGTLFSLLLGSLRNNGSLQQSTPLVSVVVAARNEEHTIAHLLDSLLHQSYPRYEVLLVDDRSTDATPAIAAGYLKSSDKLRLIQVDSMDSSDLPSKKRALMRGILSSRGDILCFTDADCVPGPGWLAGMVRRFDANVGLVAGYSPYQNELTPDANRPSRLPLFLDGFLRYEELKAAFWSAASIGLNLAWLCTGRNLAYRRSVWDQVDGFEHIKRSVSGDDDLFLQHVRKKTDWIIRYTTDPSTFVPTKPPPDFRSFVQQRIRHFSAGKYFSRPMQLFFFLFHASNLLLFIGLIVGILSPAAFSEGLWMFGVKLLLDLLLINRASKMFHESGIRSSFLLMELYYVLYNTFIGPLGLFLTFQWKPEQKS